MVLDAKHSLANNDVPKYNLGTRREEKKTFRNSLERLCHRLEKLVSNDKPRGGGGKRGVARFSNKSSIITLVAVHLLAKPSLASQGVPKCNLGTRREERKRGLPCLSDKPKVTTFAPVVLDAKHSLANNDVPKYNLGTRRR
ncbi:MAG: hypothetical protein AB1424_00715 [Thermodesulfobacteriota bacterium]